MLPLTSDTRVETPRRIWLGLVAILAVYFAIFARSVGFDFVWDDVHSLRDSPLFDRPLREALLKTEHARIDEQLVTMQGQTVRHESYRPVIIASHALDVSLFGRRPGPMHVHNLLLGAVAVVLSFCLALSILGHPASALAVAFVFALHPLVVEPVCYISARSDLLAGVLGLTAALLVTTERPAHRWLRLAAAGVCFVASLFAKEAHVTLPFALFVLAIGTQRWVAWRAGIAALLVALVAYFFLRAALIPSAPAITSASSVGRALWEFPALALQSLAVFLAPFDLSIARPFAPSLAPVAWGVGLVLAGTLWLWGGRHTEDPTRRAIALSCGCLLFGSILLAPGALAVRSMDAVADRYLYLALFGFACAVVTLFDQIRARLSPLGRKSLIGAAALYGVLLTTTSAIQAGTWRNNDALYAHAAEMEPASSVSQYRLGYLLAARKRWAESIEYFNRALALDPTNERALNNLGVAYLSLGRLDQAETALRRLLKVSGNFNFKAWYNLGEVQAARKDRPAACDSWRRTLKISPDHRRARERVSQFCGAGTASPGPR